MILQERDEDLRFELNPKYWALNSKNAGVVKLFALSKTMGILIRRSYIDFVWQELQMGTTTAYNIPSSLT